MQIVLQQTYLFWIGVCNQSSNKLLAALALALKDKVHTLQEDIINIVTKSFWVTSHVSADLN
jgi:ribosomal protein S13